MSSIKQVQDLEKQIERVKRENGNLRRILQDKDVSLDGDGEPRDQSTLLPPALGSEPKRRPPPASVPELANARANARTFSKGIWTPPALHRSHVPTLFEPPRSDLPPFAMVDELLRSYFGFAHTMYPIIHLPTFRAAVDSLYRAFPSQVSPSWLSLFFSVLATGSLFGPESPTTNTFHQPAELLDSARKLIDPWNNEWNLEHAQALTLITICLNEMNLKAAAWSWLGNAVRVGQDLGLYVESGPWPVIDGEMRRRTWWTIYIMDRTLAGELGHPFMIMDDDCDISLPAGVDDQYIRQDGMLVPKGAEPLTHSLLAVIHVTRSYTALFKALALPTMSPNQEAVFDVYFKKCLGTFPPACDPASSVPLAPNFLAPLTYLLHVRLLLYRHHLNPSCPPDLRLAAVEKCTQIALESALLINRCSASLSDVATALLTTHLFRCSLFLLLTGYFDHAISCVRALATFESRRDVTISCGRYMSFFVSALGAKRAEYADYLMRTGPPGHFHPPHSPLDPTVVLASLARDEELLVYVSADLQASPVYSWAWTERGPSIDHASPPAPALSRDLRSGLFSAELRTGLSEAERRDWGGWARLESSIRSLMTGPAMGTPTPSNAAWTSLPPPQIKPDTPAPALEIPRLSDAPRYGSDPPRFASPGSTNSPVPGGSVKKPSDRLSIANII